MGLSLPEPKADAAGLEKLLRRWWDILRGPALAAPWVNPRAITLRDVVIGTAATRIEHKLGAVPSGWIAFHARGGATTGYPVQLVDATARELYLFASASATWDLVVWP